MYKKLGSFYFSSALWDYKFSFWFSRVQVAGAQTHYGTNSFFTKRLVILSAVNYYGSFCDNALLKTVSIFRKGI